MIGRLPPDGRTLTLQDLELLFIYVVQHPGSSIVITPAVRPALERDSNPLVQEKS